jgi:hypothetical protein
MRPCAPKFSGCQEVPEIKLQRPTLNIAGEPFAKTYIVITITEIIDIPAQTRNIASVTLSQSFFLIFPSIWVNLSL